MLNSCPEFKKRKLTGLIFLVTLLLLFANLFVTNTLSTSGQELRQLQLRKENLEEQNSRLKLKLISQSTLEVIDARAESLGMIKAANFYHLNLEPEVAMHQP